MRKDFLLLYILSLLLHIEKITFPCLKLDYFFKWHVSSKFFLRTLGFARKIILLNAQDFDFHDFSAMPSLVLFHGDSKIERGLIFFKAWS